MSFNDSVKCDRAASNVILFFKCLEVLKVLRLNEFEGFGSIKALSRLNFLKVLKTNTVWYDVPYNVSCNIEIQYY